MAAVVAVVLVGGLEKRSNTFSGKSGVYDGVEVIFDREHNQKLGREVVWGIKKHNTGFDGGQGQGCLVEELAESLVFPQYPWLSLLLLVERRRQFDQRYPPLLPQLKEVSSS